jgi:hypothetical protein
MREWADKVEHLQVHCPECRRIARRILRDQPLLQGEKRHPEQEVTATREVINQRVRDGVEMHNRLEMSRHGI